MAQVHPFRAFRYNPARAAFDRVLTQPYDKISPAMQEKYYAADPHNLIAIEKGRVFPNDSPQNNVYTRAASAFQDWIRSNIVVQDPAPSFYAYTQEYAVPGTEERRTRRGFIGTGKLEDYSAGIVFRHEQTLSGPKADRLELLRHTRTHTGQLFMLYSDAERRVDAILAEAESSSAPATELRDEYGVVHRLWVIAEPERVAAIQQAMADQKLVIADGHHRYETALTYRYERRREAGHIDPSAPYEFAMMTFINTRSEGLIILPTHRVAANLHDFSWPSVRRHLEPWFTAEAFSFRNEGERAEARSKFLNRLAETRAQRSIGVYPAAQGAKHAHYVLTLRSGTDLAQLLPNVSPLQRELDVVLLHEGILEPALGITPQAVTSEKNLTYEREASVALDAVDSGAAQIAFLLNACDVEQVMRIATAGEVLPQKSTDFYPKLLSGITMYQVEGGAK
ncbi:MAG TPA: DUF1015 domain-containing protein [Candidatus Acidoferrum sp.]|nr:DUF1015 domain-containing protein [Candidatus Acidoferrum sp.]